MLISPLWRLSATLASTRLFLEANEVGILYGNDSSAAPVINAVDIIREKKNTALVGSGSIFQSMNSTVTMNLSVIFKLRGVNFTIAGACASGSQCHRHGLSAYQIGTTGLHLMRWCTGSQSVCRRQFRRTERILYAGSGARKASKPSTNDATASSPVEEPPVWYSKAMNRL